MGATEHRFLGGKPGQKQTSGMAEEEAVPKMAEMAEAEAEVMNSAASDWLSVRVGWSHCLWV